MKRKSYLGELEHMILLAILRLGDDAYGRSIREELESQVGRKVSRRKRRLVVVDASVVGSAGETDHPVSSSCRSCLEEIRLICHRVVLTAALRE